MSRVFSYVVDRGGSAWCSPLTFNRHPDYLAMNQKSRTAVDASFEVVWPLGRFATRPVKPAAALPDLNGKTVCELWDGVFRGDEIYPILRAELQTKFPAVKIVDYKAMGNTHGFNESEYVANLPAWLRQHGAHAVISAVGA